MSTFDWVILIGYLVMMALIGLYSMFKVKVQEDYFMGGRSFGKLIQAFAAFGAGTGANDPVVLGRTTFTSGLSGIWSVLLWLFVTPFYWIFGVWYRRMRHLTLGDWWVERYESKGLGAAYALFALYFYVIYLSVAFAAVGKVCVGLIGSETVTIFGQEYNAYHVFLPLIALTVIVYGVLGGLRAAYLTDLIQGIFIILLSLILIPVGLRALVDRYEPETASETSTLEGFRIMHEQVPADYFEIIESPVGGEFPLYYIIAITVINLLGIVVQPHFIATGGGSAKTENSARVGLVAGNFLKRFCTVGWALTGLIVLALLADNTEIAGDPDRVWGVASRQILGPLNLGLVGLMLACLLAALMSSADCYMIVSSALVVRNIYAAYIKPDATEKQYVLLGRLIGVVLIAGATITALISPSVFDNLKDTWFITTIFMATFWLGMFWRRATRLAAWVTVITATLLFFVLPKLIPMVAPGIYESEHFTRATLIKETYITREARQADVAKRDAGLELIKQEEEKIAKIKAAGGTVPEGDNAGIKALRDTFGFRTSNYQFGPEAYDFKVGDPITVLAARTGGKPVFFTGGVKPLEGEPQFKTLSIEREVSPNRTVIVVTKQFTSPLKASGDFRLEYLLFDWLGLPLETYSDQLLETLKFPALILTPFLVMLVVSLVTPRNSKQALDWYYAKMKTPVDPDHAADAAELEKSYADPRRFDHKKLLGPDSSWEFQKPTFTDVVGFIVSVLICFAIIFLTVWVAKIGA